LKKRIDDYVEKYLSASNLQEDGAIESTEPACRLVFCAHKFPSENPTRTYVLTLNHIMSLTINSNVIKAGRPRVAAGGIRNTG
jgi:hypothetical protein